MKKRVLALCLSLVLCVFLLPAAFAAEDETYLISITTADGVVTSGYRDNWRWVALGRADPGRPGILLRGEDPNVEGVLNRSDGLAPGDALDAWGKAQDGKAATLTLGKESWECTARYKDYGTQSVLYVEFPMNEAGTRYSQPDFEIIQLFRYDWAQENAARYSAALKELLQAEGYVVDRQLESPSSVLVLRHKDGGESPDYELYWAAKLAYIAYANPVKRLLLPSTALADGHAPTDKAPDSMTLSEDGETFTYTYSFPSPLLDGETVLHEAGSYVYEVDTVSGEVSVIHASGGQVTELARKLKALGLFLGDESGNFNLDKAPTRVEALVMLIRALGEEFEAKYSPHAPHPFTDVPEWADGYVSWGYEKGYTKGVSATEFGTNTTAGADMYLTFMLRALGYTEGAGGQFTWDQPYFLAYKAEILPFEANYVQFTRGDAVMVTSAALWADLAGGDKTLADRLMEQHFFTAAEFSTQFPQDPFSWEHSLKPLVAQAMDAASPTGQTDRRTIGGQEHIMTYAVADGDVTTAYVLAAHGSRTLTETGVDTSGTYSQRWQIDFTTSTGEVLSCGEISSYDKWPSSVEEPDDRHLLFTPSLFTGVKAKLDALMASGQVAYIRPTYDEAVAELRSGLGHHNEQTFETGECTIFVYDRGGFMNAPTGAMALIYKPGSALGEGTVIGLPHAWVKPGLAICYPADTMVLSEDEKTFTYTYYREQDLGEPVQKAGVITYTVDLPTGRVSENWAPHSYATSLAHVTRRRIGSSGERSEDREIVQTLETNECTVVLTRDRFVNKYDNYILSLVYKPGSALGDGTIR